MYQTLGYYSVYDASIESHCEQIISQHLAMSKKFRDYVAPQVTVEVIKKNKPKMIKRDAQDMSELILAHAQRISALSQVPLDTIVTDLTDIITEYQAS